MAQQGTVSTDPALWTIQRRFGVAGGPDRVVLTEEGLARAFSVGAKVRRGAPAKALELLWSYQGEGFLCVSVPSSGTKLRVTDFGRIDQIAWGYLREKGYVESIAPEHGVHGGGVRITEAGKAATWAGIEERKSLLARCVAASGLAEV